MLAIGLGNPGEYHGKVPKRAAPRQFASRPGEERKEGPAEARGSRRPIPGVRRDVENRPVGGKTSGKKSREKGRVPVVGAARQAIGPRGTVKTADGVVARNRSRNSMWRFLDPGGYVHE